MRLIDADELLEIIRRDWSLFQGATYIGDQARRDELTNVIAEIINAPTIEAEPVVRCKECKHSQYDELFHMRWCNGEEVKDDDFCSYGERKDDER